jgi:hypothetical protein
MICFFRRYHFIDSREATIFRGLFVTQIGEDETRKSNRQWGDEPLPLPQFDAAQNERSGRKA